MKNFQLSRDDLLYMKWSILFFVVVLATVIYVSLRVDALDNIANQRLNASQQRLNNARLQVEAIAEEESTIVEYTDRYNSLAAEGILAEEDRLQFKETFARIKDRHSLSPIQLNIDEQNRIRIPYPSTITNNREPVDLKYSSVKFNMALLHEQDLIRLLTDLLSTPGLYHIRECSITSNYRGGLNFFFLAQHFTGECELNWYTFDTDPESEGGL